MIQLVNRGDGRYSSIGQRKGFLSDPPFHGLRLGDAREFRLTGILWQPYPNFYSRPLASDRADKSSNILMSVAGDSSP